MRLLNYVKIIFFSDDFVESMKFSVMGEDFGILLKVGTTDAYREFEINLILGLENHSLRSLSQSMARKTRFLTPHSPHF